LTRTGAKKKSSYRVVVIDRERARDGRFVEIIGHYNPRLNPPEIVLKRERVDYWIAKGAQPSETVQSFLKKALATAPAPAA
jgi:small subunit ribosomal protein S16